jgi:hypothetical protein
MLVGLLAMHAEKPTDLGGSVLCARKGSEGPGRLGYGKRKEENKKWVSWWIWPKRVWKILYIF